MARIAFLLLEDHRSWFRSPGRSPRNLSGASTSPKQEPEASDTVPGSGVGQMFSLQSRAPFYAYHLKHLGGEQAETVSSSISKEDSELIESLKTDPYYVSQFRGTPAYAAPEQFLESWPISIAVDTWSLTVSLSTHELHGGSGLSSVDSCRR